MKRLTFKEYYESKQYLLVETSSTVNFKTKHDVYKYCKVPFTKDDNKIYFSFKPKDIIVVEWQRTGQEISPLGFQINNENYVPSWNSKKTKTWVETSTTQIFD